MANPIRDFLLDEDGDLSISNGDFALASGVEAVEQGISIRVKTFLGEIFLDESQGVDYLNQILIKNPSPLVVRELIREAIANTPDVTDVLGQQLVLNSNRTGSINYQVAHVYSSSPAVGAVEVL